MNDVTVPLPGAARKRAFGRSLSDFRIEGATTANGLLPAEEELLVAVARGEICSASDLDWKKPEDLEKLKSDDAKPFVWLLWRLHQFTSGFGYRPIRLIFILLALWLAGAAFYD
jgi:hypothetical protein